MNENFTQEQVNAIQTLINATIIGQAKGAYTLDEARYILNAIDVLHTKTEIKE